MSLQTYRTIPTKASWQTKLFSINLPNTALLAATDYCGIVSGADVNKSTLFEVFYDALETAPLISACPVNLECRGLQEFSIKHHQVFVAEVMQTYASQEVVSEQDDKHSVAPLPVLGPIIYALDNRY